jgi:hypothetical protein
LRLSQKALDTRDMQIFFTGQNAILVPVAVLLAWTTFKLWGVVAIEIVACMALGVSLRKIVRWKRTQAFDGPVFSPSTGTSFDNARLLDAPVIFYVSSVTFVVSGTTTFFDVAAAWLYVAIRIAHSVAHIMGINRSNQMLLILSSSIVLVTIVTNLVSAVV